MATLSHNAKTILNDSYSPYRFASVVNETFWMSMYFSLFENNIFNRYIEIDTTVDNVVFPTFLARYIYNNVVYNNSRPDLLICTLPIKTSNSELFKTAYSILKYINTNNGSYNINKLEKIHTEKHGVFYGNDSLILNSDFEPIFYKGFKTKQSLESIINIVHEETSPQNSSARLTNSEYFTIFLKDLCNPVFYINPKFYIEKEDIFSKYMVNNMIPHYLTYPNMEVTFKDLNIIQQPSEDVLRYENFNEVINENLVNYNNRVIFEP